VLVAGVAAILLGSCSVKELKLAPEPFREFVCYQILWAFGIDLTEEQFERRMDRCVGPPDAVLEPASALPLAITAARVTRANESQTAQYLVEKQVAAAKFPRTVLDLSPDAVRIARANSPIDRVHVLAMMALMDANLELPKLRFDGFEARLLSVDARGRTELIASTEVEFSKGNVFAEARFEEIEADEGLRVVIQPTSGQLEPAIVLASAGVAGSPESDEEETPAASSVWREGLVEGSPGGNGWIDTAKGADLQSQTSIVVYTAEKAVKVKKFPKVLIDLPSTSKLAKRPTLSVGVNLLTDGFKVPNPKQRFQSIEATLFAFDSKGRREMVATKKAKFDADGVAAVTFRRVEEPKKGYFQVRLEMVGGKVKNSLVIATASASAE
jgi:hypothetical protein